MEPPPANFPEFLAQLELIKADIAWVRAWKNMKAITANGEIPILYTEGADNVVLDLRSLTSTGAPPANTLPAQTNHAGGVLTTDGATISWL